MPKEEIMRQLLDYAYDRMENRNVYPFCAFIVKDGVIISKGANYAVNDFGDKTKHGEMVAITRANKALKSKELIILDSGYELYSTCESCLACFDTALWANIKSFTFAVDHTDFPEYFHDHPYSIQDYEKDNPGEIDVTTGILRNEAKALFLKAKEKYGW